MGGFVAQPLGSESCVQFRESGTQVVEVLAGTPHEDVDVLRLSRGAVEGAGRSADEQVLDPVVGERADDAVESKAPMALEPRRFLGRHVADLDQPGEDLLFAVEPSAVP